MSDDAPRVTENVLAQAGLYEDGQASGFKVIPFVFVKPGTTVTRIILVLGFEDGREAVWAPMNPKTAGKLLQDLSRLSAICERVEAGDLPPSIIAEITPTNVGPGGN